MFERFTTDAREVVTCAQREAHELRHDHIGTEHLLLALLRSGHGAASEALATYDVRAADVRRRVVEELGPHDDPLDAGALASLGIDLDEVRRSTEATFGPGALEHPGAGRRPRRHIPFTPRAKKTLELALREAVRIKHDHIGTGHLLLGLLREGHGRGPRILLDAGIDPAALREETTSRMRAAA